jgi:hypothetical protein
MGGTYSMHVEFYLESLKERDYSEDIGIGGRIILKGNSGK